MTVTKEVVSEEIVAACSGFAADAPDPDADGRGHALWDTRTYMRALKCEAIVGVSRARS